MLENQFQNRVAQAINTTSWLDSRLDRRRPVTEGMAPRYEQIKRRKINPITNSEDNIPAWLDPRLERRPITEGMHYRHDQIKRRKIDPSINFEYSTLYPN